MDNKPITASEMGKKSVQVRMKDLTPAQRSEYMKMVRAKKTPKVAV